MVLVVLPVVLALLFELEGEEELRTAFVCDLLFDGRVVIFFELPVLADRTAADPDRLLVDGFLTIVLLLERGWLLLTVAELLGTVRVDF